MLDASALLAWILDEPGADRVDRSLAAGEAVIGAVNFAEVLERSRDAQRTEARILALDVTVEPFDLADARTTAELRPHTRHAGLSLADRSCLALARRLGLPALTADHAWATLDVGVTIELIRP